MVLVNDHVLDKWKKVFSEKKTYSIVGCSDKLQDNHKSDENRLTVFKTKSRVEGLELVEVCEESEHEEDVDLRDENVLQDVIHLPVAQLMAQNSQNFCKNTFAIWIPNMFEILMVELFYKLK